GRCCLAATVEVPGFSQNPTTTPQLSATSRATSRSPDFSPPVNSVPSAVATRFTGSPRAWSYSTNRRGRLFADRNRRLAVADPDPAELRVRGRWVLAIFFARLRQLVGLDRLALLLHIHAEHFGRVQPQELILDFIRQVRVLVFLLELIRHFQATQPLDLALW